MHRRVFIAQLGGSVAALHAAGAASLKIRVIDAESRQQIPATVRVTTSENQVLTDNESFLRGMRSDGRVEVTVPPGMTRVLVQRGFDYSNFEQQLDLKPGDNRELIVELRRRTPLRSEGWLCGDSHVHMIHGESRVKVDFPYVSRASRAEALDYVSLSQRWQLAVESPEAVAQACSENSAADFLLTWNMEMPKNYLRGDVSHCLGHGWTLGMSGRDSYNRNVIDELNSMSAHDYERDKRPAPNFETHAYIHSVGGIVSYTHPCRWWMGKWGGRSDYPLEEQKFVSNMAQELPFDTVAGPTYDMVDILMQTHESVQNENALRLWFLLLNHGYRLAATASSDATFDNRGRGVPGSVRVYTRTTGPPAIPNIQAVMKAGRNFVTSGPLMLWTIGQYGIGDAIRISGEFHQTARLRLWAAPGDYLTKAEIFRNGELWRTLPINGKPESANLSFDIVERKDCWYAVRCYATDRSRSPIPFILKLRRTSHLVLRPRAPECMSAIRPVGR